MHGKKKIKWDRPQGTWIEAEMEGRYQRGTHSVEMYLKQTAIANPHASFHFEGPHGEDITYQRSSKELPHVGIALQDILRLNDAQRDQAVSKLDDALHKSRKIK
jgi:DNA topoisomerase VI subunit B